MSSKIEQPRRRLCEVYSAKLVLEVFGGAGAIWGFSEATGLRTPLTQWFWRPAAIVFGAIFFARWMMQIRDFMDETGLSMKNGKKVEGFPLRRLYEIYSAKLVLEVFGGGGAIWGFSEVVGLRTPLTQWFWRPCAIAFAAIFFSRWILEIRDYMDETGMNKRTLSFESKETVELMDDTPNNADYSTTA